MHQVAILGKHPILDLWGVPRGMRDGQPTAPDLERAIEEVADDLHHTAACYLDTDCSREEPELLDDPGQRGAVGVERLETVGPEIGRIDEDAERS